MGLLNKLFKSKAESKVEPKKELVDIETLKYDEQVIAVEAFRAGLKEGATIKAYRNGDFVPLRYLGKDLLIFDLEKQKYIPLVQSKNPNHTDIKEYVFGK